MTLMFEPIAIAPGSLANVSRRFVIRGLAGAGALVVGAGVMPRPERRPAMRVIGVVGS